jgi:cleavage stimulation factor subunit 1
MVDVEAVFSRSAQGHHTDVHPVIRSFYDHAGGVTTMDFHPTVSILASGSKDCSIRLFDYSKPSAKRAYQVVQEVAPVRCISFHPSGDFMIVGTEHSTLRLYDMSTQQCFVSSDARDQHAGPVTALHYSLDGRLYATCSKDGSIKVWDGVSNRCVSTFHNAHSGQTVSSVKLSRNAKYILSSGKDGSAHLWELTSARPLNTYQPSSVKLLPYRPCAVFNHTEDYVLMQEEKMQQLVLNWNSRSSQLLAPVVSGHISTILWLAHSPTSPAFMTCGSDCKMRFFCHKQ